MRQCAAAHGAIFPVTWRPFLAGLESQSFSLFFACMVFFPVALVDVEAIIRGSRRQPPRIARRVAPRSRCRRCACPGAVRPAGLDRRSPPRLFHAFTRRIRREFYVPGGFRDPADRLRSADRAAKFPLGSFLPAFRQCLGSSRSSWIGTGCARSSNFHLYSLAIHLSADAEAALAVAERASERVRLSSVSCSMGLVSPRRALACHLCSPISGFYPVQLSLQVYCRVGWSLFWGLPNAQR